MPYPRSLDSNSRLADPTHWRSRADEVRAMAHRMADPLARNAMLGIADHYDMMADRAESRVSLRRKI
jgi:hypothetical protein